MSYSLEILRSAQKALGKISPPHRQRIIAAIRDLADNPRPVGYIKLSGREAYRIRIGDYRVIYEIEESRLEVLVVALGHRRNIYR
jgi:mRNA interferase RelE/StbE